MALTLASFYVISNNYVEIKFHLEEKQVRVRLDFLHVKDNILHRGCSDFAENADL